jgi:hypothetical protein
VPAANRRFPEMTELEVLEHARAIAAPDASLDDFILEGVADYDRAREYTALLRQTAHPFSSPGRAGSSETGPHGG